MVELIPIFMFLVVFAALLAGYPVALTLAGVALLFALVGMAAGTFDGRDLGFLPGRLFGIITNPTLIAVPLFVFMGVMMEKTRIAENLLSSLSQLLAGTPGGLSFAVILVGMLMAASTGIVGATVVTLGLMSLPTMLRDRYDPAFATGTISATGTLGQIIPPSIALVLLGEVLSNAYQQAQLKQGIFAPDTVSVGDLFAGAVVPGLLLVGLYLAYTMVLAFLRPGVAPAASARRVAGEGAGSEAGGSTWQLIGGLVPPMLLIVAVLGSILAGYATPTEAAGVGAAGATILAAGYRALDADVLRQVCRSTFDTTAMVFFILVGASLFSLVFRGYGGDDLVHGWFNEMPGGTWGALAIVMVVVFLLGFMLDFIEITFVVVPIVGPVLLAMGVDPIWLGVLIAVNLQTSFLTPPFGFALFYLRGVAPPEVSTADIYRGVAPFVFLQVLLLCLLMIWPSLATWLPERIYS
ncbi:MAG: TRAP transporter large permease subunit [Pseudomonadales bacterium]|nr:TRAP transporter large permease subunit [Pseudomonadales bacterium]NIX07636.1 TRAP transporter large permease subunit [Pseudomonadales bacterium]